MQSGSLGVKSITCPHETKHKQKQNIESEKTKRENLNQTKNDGRAYHRAAPSKPDLLLHSTTLENGLEILRWGCIRRSPGIAGTIQFIWITYICKIISELFSDM